MSEIETPVQTPEASIVPTEAPIEPPKETTILGTEPKVEEIKSEIKEEPKIEQVKDEAPKDETPKEAIENKEGQSDEPALPTYDAFKLPEGFTLEEERISDFTKDLASFELKTKADHAEVQAFGQSLMDRYAAEMKNTVEKVEKTYLEAFEKQKTDWKESFEKDSEIGGNRKDTTINSALEFIRTHGGTEAQQTELKQLVEATGVGNHPALIRIFANAMNSMKEGRPLPAMKPIEVAQSKVAKRYGNI